MYKMIIVDDDAGVSNNLGNYFPWEENGFQVVEKFYDGLSAYNYLRQNQVDLILSDIKMPCMNGIELAEKLAKENRREIIVFISAYKDFEYARKALEYGVYYYFLKPFTYHEIKEKLETIKAELRKRTNDRDDKAGISISDKQIVRIKRYIEENIKSADLASIAAHVKMNQSYLSRFFKEKSGENLSTCITRIRMQQALLLLQNEVSKNISEVCSDVGYGNPVSFSKVFLRQYGVTPMEYRKDFKSIKNHREKDEI
jgi:YesN/AraC family two-component response regulator